MRKKKDNLRDDEGLARVDNVGIDGNSGPCEGGPLHLAGPVKNVSLCRTQN